MPGKASLEKGQYYAHPLNKFWLLVYSNFEVPPHPSYENRIDFLKSRRIALWDVIDQCERSGSADSKILNPVINDLENLLVQHPNLKYILFNGRTAEKLFSRNIKGKIRTSITFITLPSSSPANAGVTLAQKLEKWGVIRVLNF
jgi:methylated-DNA-[protein]-cysteine S-methyltransferase